MLIYGNFSWEKVCFTYVTVGGSGNGQGMWRVWGRIEVCTGCWWGSLRERGHWGDQDVDGRIILDGSSGNWRGS